MILAIDPGNTQSGIVLVNNDLSAVASAGKYDNEDILKMIKSLKNVDHVAIEMVASYGMAVGASVFETCVWVGRFTQAIQDRFNITPAYIFRKDEKINLCNSMKAKDSNIRQALIDRFGPVGTKKNPGYFYGFSKDMWAAMAVAVTYHDKYMKR